MDNNGHVLYHPDFRPTVIIILIDFYRIKPNLTIRCCIAAVQLGQTSVQDGRPERDWVAGRGHQQQHSIARGTNHIIQLLFLKKNYHRYHAEVQFVLKKIKGLS